jgi:hypothetical protein
MDANEAYTIYRNLPTLGTMISVEPNALHQDFVTAMTNFLPSRPHANRVDVGLDHQIQYDELMTRSYTPLYESGLSSRAPQVSVFNMSRQEDGDIEIVLTQFTSERMEILLAVPVLELGGSYLKWTSGPEAVTMTRIASPSGKQCWEFLHTRRGRPGRPDSVMLRLYLVELGM